MIRDHLSGVMAYFTHRITNAVAEGMNSKIATIHHTSATSFIQYREQIFL